MDSLMRECRECGRIFDLRLDVCAYQWYWGHGCEVIGDDGRA